MTAVGFALGIAVGTVLGALLAWLPSHANRYRGLELPRGRRG